VNATRMPGPVRWLIVSAPVAIWMVHLVASAAVVQFATTHDMWTWVLYVITPLCVVPILVCMAASRALQTAAGDDPEGGSENSQLAFIGELGVYLGAFNLLLVVAEGVMVPVLFNHG
jgi:hypothetical protein